MEGYGSPLEVLIVIVPEVLEDLSGPDFVLFLLVDQGVHFLCFRIALAPLVLLVVHLGCFVDRFACVWCAKFLAEEHAVEFFLTDVAILRIRIIKGLLITLILRPLLYRQPVLLTVVLAHIHCSQTDVLLDLAKCVQVKSP